MGEIFVVVLFVLNKGRDQARPKRSAAREYADATGEVRFGWAMTNVCPA